MQPYQPLQLLHVLTHMAWARLTRPQFPEYRTNDPAFYPVCYPTFKRMREEKKIFYVTRFLGWVVGGDYDTLVTLLRDDRLTVRPTAEAELRARARALRRGTDDGPDYSAADEDDAAPASHRGEA